jgi:hypothetical protein
MQTQQQTLGLCHCFLTAIVYGLSILYEYTCNRNTIPTLVYSFTGSLSPVCSAPLPIHGYWGPQGGRVGRVTVTTQDRSYEL